MCDSRQEREILPVDVASFDTSVVLNDENSLTTISEEIEEIYCENFADVNQSAINVQNSSEVVIGPVTQFHGPVTIYQNINGTATTNVEKDPKYLENGIKDRKVEFKNNVKRMNSEHSPEKVEKITSLNLIWLCRRCSINIGIWLVSAIIIVFLAYLIRKQLFNSCENCDDGYDDPKKIGIHRIIYRSEWGGKSPLNIETMDFVPNLVIISHTNGNFCKTPQLCLKIMQKIQLDHLSQNLSDVGYNFLIGGDSNIYVGRGWDAKNFHPHSDGNTISISFMGNFYKDRLTRYMCAAALKLMMKGVELKKLDENYKIVAQNQTHRTDSPGENIFEEIQIWPHYFSGNI